MFESPIHGIEKVLLRRVMPTPQRRLSKTKGSINNNNSQSTVTDSVESAWLLKLAQSVAPNRDNLVLKLVVVDNKTSEYRLVPYEETDKKWYFEVGLHYFFLDVV